jgi:hypothetical protein
MTLDNFNKARVIKEQIEHIDRILEDLTRDVYSGDSPNKQTRWGLTDNSIISIRFNQAEIITITEALYRKREILSKKFDEI